MVYATGKDAMPPTPLIDYCDALPCEGKFLRLTWRGKPFLLFAPTTRFRYHNQLLAHFAQTHAIPHRWLSESELSIDHPVLKIHGGGRFRADDDTLELWDDSQAYGRFLEEGLERMIAEADHRWSRLTVVIRRPDRRLATEAESNEPVGRRYLGDANEGSDVHASTALPDTTIHSLTADVKLINGSSVHVAEVSATYVSNIATRNYRKLL